MKKINAFGAINCIVALIVIFFPGYFDNSTNAWVKFIAIMIATSYTMK